MCLFIMFLVAGGGDTTRVQRQERKKVRKYSVYLFRRRSSSSCGSCGSWRASLTQTCPLFSQVFRLFFTTADPPSHNLDVVALSSFLVSLRSRVLFLLLRLQSDHALPLPLALLISSLCCTRSVSSLLSLTHSSVCVCIVWVCTNGREFLRSAPIGRQRPARIGCTLCIVRENRQGGGGKNSSRLGSGESGDGVRGCFCFEMAEFETRRGASRFVCQWHTELIGPDCRPVCPLAKEAAVLLCFCPRRAVWSCASLVSSPAALAARAPKCSPPLAF